MKLWKTFGIGLNVSFFMIGALGIIETGSWISEFEWKVSPICLDSWTLGPHLAIIVLEGLGSMAYAGRSTYVTRDGLWEWISLTLSLFSIYCCGLSYSYSWYRACSFLPCLPPRWWTLTSLQPFNKVNSKFFRLSWWCLITEMEKQLNASVKQPVQYDGFRNLAAENLWEERTLIQESKIWKEGRKNEGWRRRTRALHMLSKGW